MDIDAREGAGAGKSITELPALVRFENASLGYNSAAVLHDVSVKIYAGELVGLVGPNGSGKTTLFRTILGLLAPLGGVLTRGCPLANFGYVPQSATLDPQFPLSAAEIVEMGAYGRVPPFKFMPAGRKGQSRPVTRAGRHGTDSTQVVFCPFRRAKTTRADRPGAYGRPEDHGARRAVIGRRRRVPTKHYRTVDPADPRKGFGGVFFQPRSGDGSASRR